MPILQIDWKNPDYADVFKERARRLAWLRKDAARLHKVRKYYATAQGVKIACSPGNTVTCITILDQVQ
jgi:hypothetical protein